ncbi:MAG: hypothetical protein JXL97_04065 [Bacteroidales bacterium]|jgi:hypothetical protein|nr:hypothetical protein [Bacteroidales bacterium]
MKYQIHIFYSGEIKHFKSAKRFQQLVDTLDKFGFLYCVYIDGIRDETYENQ